MNRTIFDFCIFGFVLLAVGGGASAYVLILHQNAEPPISASNTNVQQASAPFQTESNQHPETDQAAPTKLVSIEGVAVLPDQPITLQEKPEDQLASVSDETWNLIQQGLVDRYGRTPSDVNLAKQKHVLIYFSAGWCPPCRALTPKLVDFYNKNGGGTEFEMIFVSADQTERDMLSYMKSAKMPWTAVSPRQTTLQKTLRKFHSGTSIPCLVLLDENFQIIANTYQGKRYTNPMLVVSKLSRELKTQ